MTTQFKKGIIELCVLKVIEDKQRSSVDVIDVLEKVLEVSDNTTYPILRRLQSQGYVASERVSSPIGAPRKMYSISQEGQEHLKQMIDEWGQFIESVHEIIGGNYE
jgi:PadR family transcriptional regulator PadR